MFSYEISSHIVEEDHIISTAVNKTMEHSMNMDRFSYLKLIEENSYTIYNYMQYINPKDAELLESRRVEICAWMYRFVDSYDLCRDIVARAMSYLDRFLVAMLTRQNKNGDLNTPSFAIESSLLQLASMTALNIAIKLTSPLKWNTNHMIRCSRGKFTLNQIISMEHQMLHVLAWRLNPPTSSEFIMLVTSLVFEVAGRPELANFFSDVGDMATFFTELSVWDSFFLEHMPSTVAIASILNSTESLDNNLPVGNTSLTSLFINALQSLDILPCEEALHLAQSRLHEDYLRSEDNQDSSEESPIRIPSNDRAYSPTSVVPDIRGNHNNIDRPLLQDCNGY